MKLSEMLIGVVGMSKQQRLIRLCELGAKQIKGSLSPADELEIAAIQTMRQANGEIDEITKQREETETAEDYDLPMNWEPDYNAPDKAERQHRQAEAKKLK